MQTATTFEDLIDELGGLGRFQALVIFCVVSCQFTAGWSMLQMSFAGMIPDFSCLPENDNDTSFNNDSLNACSVNGSSCQSFVFHSDVLTVIEEWGLVCDLSWVKATITSIQMFGVLTGGLSAGQLSDVFGRRKTLYSFVFTHIVGNFIAAFSTSWVMFAVMRFFIGVSIGAILVVVFPYPMEFLPVKWRPLLSIIPSWTLGVALFACAALVLGNWSHLHLACGLFTVPSMFGLLFVPESVRWLTVHGHTKEAEDVIKKIARLNRKPVPEATHSVLQQIIKQESQSRASGRKYTYLDLFQSFHFVKTSLILCFFWFTLSATFYGISFGVASLFGNIYLNIFLLGIMELPVQTSTFYFSNKIGRRRSSLLFYGLACLSSSACLVSHLAATGDTRGVLINTFSQLAKMMVGSAWSCTQTWGAELYPTVTRNLGYGFSNMGARVGGIVAPFIINLDDNIAMSYSIMSGLLFTVLILAFALPETKDVLLTDSLNQHGKDSVKHHVKETKELEETPDHAEDTKVIFPEATEELTEEKSSFIKTNV